MIKSFRDRDTERPWNRIRVRRFQAFERQARRRLEELNAAARLDDLARLPGDRLRALSGDRKGRYALRINAQWRLCFEWNGEGARNVEITDYHSNRVSDILRARRGISANTALRLGRHFGTSPEFWLDLQNRYDLETARNAMRADIERIKRGQTAR
jgi:proteic killer suppression protein